MSAEAPRFAIVAARFYEDIAESLVHSATAVFAAAGAEGIDVFDVPGAYELPLAAPFAASRAATPAWRVSAASSAARPTTTTTSAASPRAASRTSR